VTVVTGPTAPPRPPSSRRGLLRALAAGALLAAAGGGVGGWLWLREPDSGKRGGSTAAGSRGSASPTASTAAALPAAVLWRAHTGMPADNSGPCAALSPDHGTVYVTCADGTLRAVAADGTEKWRLSLSTTEVSVLSPPAVTSDGTVFVVFGPQKEGGSYGLLVAVSAAGKRKWSHSLLWNFGYEGPVVAGDMVLVGFGDPMGGAGGVRAYDTAGGLKWTGDVGAGPDVAPLVVGDIAYVGGYDNYLYAFAVSDGRELWRTQLDSDVARPAVAGHTIAVSTNDQNNYYLYGLTTDGRRTWKKKGRGGGYMSYTTAVGSVFLTVNNSGLTATGSDGSALWTYKGAGNVTDPVTRGDTIYLRSGTELQALDTKGALRWKLGLGGDTGQTQTSPVLAGDRLYTTTSDGLVAVRLKA
jgi:outer membrane protein assembly factor BamB